MSKKAQAAESRYKAQFASGAVFTPIYYGNAFDHPDWPVITNEDPETIQMFRWGLIPGWVKDAMQADEISNKTLNARCETAMTKPSFRSVKKKRCLVLSDGFYEWMDVKGKKYPHFIYMDDHSIFSMAGIWEEWVNKETAEIVHSFSIITTPANPLLARIHNVKQRMPAILSREQERLWISEDLPPAQLMELLVPFPDAHLRAHTISRLITSRTEERNVPRVQAPHVYAELDQGGLFG